MTKTRFTASDVRAAVRDLRATVLGLRVVNVYDLDAKTFLFKLASPGQDKAMLLLESGVRFHTTKFNHAKSDMPSGFSMKLRKHIRTQRLEDVRQVGMDRVVDFKFGSGEASNHVILELYASGNIILTDYKYEILDLLRTHTYDGQGDTGSDVRVAVRQIYPMELATTQEGMTGAEEGKAFANGLPLEEGVSRMSAWLERAAVNASAATAAAAAAQAELREGASPAVSPEDGSSATGAAMQDEDGRASDRGSSVKKRAGGGGGGAKKAKKATLKQALLQKGSGVYVYGPSILEHCVLRAGLRPNVKLTESCKGGRNGDLSAGGLSADEVSRLVTALAAAEETVQQLDRPGQQGYIQCKALLGSSSRGTGDTGGGGDSEGGKAENSADPSGEAENVVYEEFLPQLLAQHEHSIVHAFPSFDHAVDAFFGRIVEQKLKQTAIAAETAVEKKVAFIRDDQERRVRALEERQEKMLRHAQLAEAWADEVEKALMVIRSALANGMDWSDLTDLVKAETANGNPIASLIHELRLDRNKVVLALATADGNQELVEVDIMLSAHANARAMFEKKKLARAKELKTLQASEKVLKIAEQQAQKTLQRQAHKRSLQVARKTYWFEKFNWFITSENYLVISGRDAQQNEVVVKKYLRPGDIYVHADLHGASSCVVRNKDPSGKRPVSPLALEEAGCMTVCRSGAWGAKMVTSAWWVYADQVSKTAPTGEYLVTGSFMVRGKKNFLPPRSLEMGFALLFKLDDSCLGAHVGERRERGSSPPDGNDDRGAAGTHAAAKGTKTSNGSGQKIDDGVTTGHMGTGDVRDFEAPLGLNDQRRAASGTEEASDANGDGGRRAAALAALAGLGAANGDGGEQRPGSSPIALPPGPGGSQNSHGDLSKQSATGERANVREARVPEASKKRLSAKERRLMKKGGNAGVGGTETFHAISEEAGIEGGASTLPGARTDEGKAPTSGGTQSGANASASLPRGKRGKLKRMKKKYADQDEEDRLLAMEALGVAKADHEGDGEREGRRRCRDGDGKEAAAAEAAAEAAVSKNLLQVEAERTAALSALDERVRSRLEEAIKPDELDPFEVRALGRFGVTDAMDILERFAEADLRKVRNRSGFLAGIMRKHGSTSAAAADSSSTSTGGVTGGPATSTLGANGRPVADREGGMDAGVEGESDAVGTDGANAALPPGLPTEEGSDAATKNAACLDLEPQGNDGVEEDEGVDAEREGGRSSSCARVEGTTEVGAGEAGEITGNPDEDKEQLSRRAQKRREDEEVRKLLLEEEGADDGLDGLDGDVSAAAAAAASELDRLTGKPREEDVLLFAVAVCGPYMSLRDYKYKVKLTPGKQKRGKASKQAVEVFSRARDTPPQHRALMKGVTDNECVQAMIGDVKVSVAGLAQATQAKKKANKQQAQKDPKKAPKQTKTKAKGGKKK